jgi:hypothetical protein
MEKFLLKTQTTKTNPKGKKENLEGNITNKEI